eukprot:scaffold39081_cov28-Attheya_sp.AAC.2
MEISLRLNVVVSLRDVRLIVDRSVPIVLARCFEQVAESWAKLGNMGIGIWLCSICSDGWIYYFDGGSVGMCFHPCAFKYEEGSGRFPASLGFNFGAVFLGAAAMLALMSSSQWIHAHEGGGMIFGDVSGPWCWCGDNVDTFGGGRGGEIHLDGLFGRVLFVVLGFVGTTEVQNFVDCQIEHFSFVFLLDTEGCWGIDNVALGGQVNAPAWFRGILDIDVASIWERFAGKDLEGQGMEPICHGGEVVDELFLNLGVGDSASGKSVAVNEGKGNWEHNNSPITITNWEIERGFALFRDPIT